MDTSSPIDRLNRLPHPTGSQKLLDKDVGSPEPLKTTVAGLANCIETYEDVLGGKREYEVLRDELENIFEMLNQCYGEEELPVITPSLESLCKDIDLEVQGVKEKLNQDRVRISGDAPNDLIDVFGCYARMRNHLRRISLNLNVSVWRIGDASATETRLNRLRPVMAARYSSALTVGLKRGSSTESSQADVLAKMAGWVGTSDPGSVYWMSGMDRASKTSIAYSLCDKLAAEGKLAASFFCSRLVPECRDVNRIIPSIAYQLARFSRPFLSVLLEVLEKDSNMHNCLSHPQFDALIVQPLRRVKDTLPDNLVVMIYALDECENKDGTHRMVDVLLTKLESLPVKFVVSSPPEPEIWDRMTEQSDYDDLRVVLRELDRHTVMLEFSPEKPQV
ncbi:unnamed protein product [Rhizoctonia solani]|uniref:Nephrocystin 3-like N-terminal domain-containing protein n=1 Tax=Rhizoctonia solani TaxID=456999 RepID=A0A8H3GEA0_9AGAM|nr:unnamed protein product [Rhizoctonia solani]